MSGSLRDSAIDHFNETISLMEKGQPKEALEKLEKAEEAAQQAEAYDVLLPIMSIKGELLLSIGALDDVLRVCGFASNFFADILSKEPEEEFIQQSLQTNLKNIGTVGYSYQNAGRFPQAKNAYETGLDISLKLLQSFSQDEFLQNYTGRMLNNLGALLSDMGKIEDAKSMYEKALKIQEKLLENDPENVTYQSNVGTTLNNLGALLSDMGRIEDAKNRYEKALEIREKLLENDPENETYQSYVGTTLNNLGTLLWTMGRIEEAKNRYEKALEIREKLLENGPENVTYQSNVGTTLNNLGALLSDMGRIEEAKNRYEKALEIYEKLLENDSENVSYQSNVGATLNNLGASLKTMGRIEEAKNRYEKALEIYEKLLENDLENVIYQSYVGTTLNNLGALLSDMGRIEEAKNRYEKALEIREKLSENDLENVTYQSDAAMTLNNLGTLLKTMGRIEESRNRYEKALEICTEPMQYLTIGRKAESIIRLLQLNSEQAEKETNPFNQMNYLREIFQLCKKHREFFVKYELNHERKLVTEAGLSAYIDFLMMIVKVENNPEKRAKKYEKALQAVENLGEMEEDETISRLCSSAACYLRGRKLVNEALASRQPELELLRQAVEQFKSAKETYDRANVCFCVYIGLLKILEDVNELEEVDVPKLKELVKKVIETLPEDVNPSIRVSFENIPQIFEEKDKMTRKELLKKLDERVSIIEYKALENFFGHIHEKIKDYFEEPFSPNLIYENWKLKVTFDDPEKVKGRLTVKAGNKIISPLLISSFREGL